MAYKKSLIEKTLRAITWVRYSILGGSPETYSLLHRVNMKQFNILLKTISHKLNSLELSIISEKGLNIILFF